MEFDRQSLDEWAKDKPLSILQLDPADRAVLKIAGKMRAIVQGRCGRCIRVSEGGVRFSCARAECLESPCMRLVVLWRRRLVSKGLVVLVC